MTLSFTRLSETARPPAPAHPGDAGHDLHAAEGAVIEPGARASVGTGLALAIPDGLAGLVLPCSGLALRHGIALVNAPGLIDSGYRGEVRVLLLNTDRHEPFEVELGDRVAQLVLIAPAVAGLREVESLPETARGGGGFGSTGR